MTFTQGHGLDGPWGMVAGKKQSVRNSLHVLISVTCEEVAWTSLGEAVWPRGLGAGIEIWSSLAQILLSGFVQLKFNSSTMLCKYLHVCNQLVS